MIITVKLGTSLSRFALGLALLCLAAAFGGWAIDKRQQAERQLRDELLRATGYSEFAPLPYMKIECPTGRTIVALLPDAWPFIADMERQQAHPCIVLDEDGYYWLQKGAKIVLPKIGGPFEQEQEPSEDI